MYSLGRHKVHDLWSCVVVVVGVVREASVAWGMGGGEEEGRERGESVCGREGEDGVAWVWNGVRRGGRCDLVVVASLIAQSYQPIRVCLTAIWFQLLSGWMVFSSEL